MECGLCQQPANPERPLICGLCAQQAIYRHRVALAQSFLENESLAQQVEKEISPSKPQRTSFLSSKTPESNAKWTHELYTGEADVTEETIQELALHTKQLREELQHMRLEIAKRKARLNQRRKEQTSARAELADTSDAGNEPLQAECRDINRYWEKIQGHTRDIRLESCNKTARLYSLRLEKQRSSSKRQIFSIGFLPIPDLRDLNTSPPAQLTATLLHIAGLVHMASNQLGVKLPAQILLPTPTYPKPLILSQSASYTTVSYVIPGTNHPRTRDASLRSQPRARPLYVDKPLAALSKDEPLNYALAVEGITLLAWDIAWLCRTQGHDIGRGSWEEVCAMGRNLHHLLLGPPAPIASSQQSTIPSTLASQATVTTTKSDGTQAPPRIFTQASRHNFLNGKEGVEYMRDWSLGNSINVIHRVKALLLAERTGAEWELLEGDDWAAEDQPPEPGGTGLDGTSEDKVVNGLAGSGQPTIRGAEATRDALEQTGVLVKAEGAEHADGKVKGQRGWTKIRGR